MHRRIMEIFLIFMLVFVFPAAIVSFTYDKEQVVVTESEQKPATTTNMAREMITVETNDGQIINMPLNDYITCVLLSEMPTSFEAEALKAQTIVARTYALRRMETTDKHSQADICMDPACCQGFRMIEEHLNSGGSKEEIERVKNAVRQTEDMVLVYEGELIEATYFSSSGGMTEDAVAVWGSDVPYLQATESPGEEQTKYYMNTEKFSISEFEKRLDVQFNYENDWLGDISYTDGGGVDKIVICGIEFTGKEVRQKLGLRSTAFAIQITGENILVTTKGFGHRVGMSQYGAQAMALNGKTCDEILKHYYKGVEIKNGFG